MANEVTKKDIDALNKRIDALEKAFKEEIKRLDGRADSAAGNLKRIDENVGRLGEAVNSHAKSIDGLQDAVRK
jgi:hypothetical protein